jgi:uncharacterized protein
MKTALFVSLAALFLVPSMAEAQNPIQQTITGTRLDVSARGESRVVPDVAIINAGVVTQAADAQTAMRDNAQRMNRVIAALKAAGVADKDVQTSSVNLSPQYRYAENQAPIITGYQANNQVTVRFRDVGKSGAVLDALVKQGVNQINGPNLVVDEPAKALDAARIAAMKDARARAELYAKAAGMNVKRIVSISEANDYNPGPVPMMARAASMDVAEAKTSVVAGEQALGVSLNVVFELQ